MHNHKNVFGETLVEALVSLTILMSSTIVASSTIIYAMQSVALSKDYLVAQNLGSEAIEIVKNIRDTNLMINSTNKDDCWTVISPTLEIQGNQCTNMKRLEIGDPNPITYIPKQDTNNQWILEKLDKNLNLNSGVATDNEYFKIYKEAISSTTPPVYVYSNYTIVNRPADAIPTNFYRQIKVLEITEVSGKPESVLIEVKIQWFTGAKVNEMKGVTLITNH